MCLTFDVSLRVAGTGLAHLFWPDQELVGFQGSVTLHSAAVTVTSPRPVPSAFALDGRTTAVTMLGQMSTNSSSVETPTATPSTWP